MRLSDMTWYGMMPELSAVRARFGWCGVAVFSAALGASRIAAGQQVLNAAGPATGSERAVVSMPNGDRVVRWVPRGWAVGFPDLRRASTSFTPPTKTFAVEGPREGAVLGGGVAGGAPAGEDRASVAKRGRGSARAP